jgi:hypothetical protein
MLRVGWDTWYTFDLRRNWLRNWDGTESGSEGHHRPPYERQERPRPTHKRKSLYRDGKLGCPSNNKFIFILNCDVPFQKKTSGMSTCLKINFSSFLYFRTIFYFETFKIAMVTFLSKGGGLLMIVNTLKPIDSTICTKMQSKNHREIAE